MVLILILVYFWQVEDLGVYVGAAKCLSALSDSEIDRIARVAEVKCCDLELLEVQSAFFWNWNCVTAGCPQITITKWL